MLASFALSCQSRFCRVVVLGLRGGGARPALEEVTTAEIGDLRGRGEVHEGFRSPLGRDRKQLRSPQDEREEAAAFFAEAAGDEARMQAVDGDAFADPTARKFAREQDVAQLRSLIGRHAVVGPRELQILETELRALVGGRGGVDHPCRRRREQGLAQTVAEHEIGHVVEGKGALEPFGGEAAIAEDRTGIVDQDIDPPLLRRDLGRHALDFCDEHEIGVQDAVRRAGSARSQSPERGLAARPVARDQNEPRPHGREPLGRDLADA